jgi:hypothetical protein
MEAIFPVGIFPKMRNSYALKFNHIMTLQGFSFIRSEILDLFG